MNGTEIEQLRDVIESTLDDCGMADVPWYCTAEPSAPRQRPSMDRRLEGPAVRVLWKRREGVLEFCDERGGLFRTVHLENEHTAEPLELTAAGAGMSAGTGTE